MSYSLMLVQTRVNHSIRFIISGSIQVIAALFILNSCGAPAVITARKHLRAGDVESARQILQEELTDKPTNDRALLLMALIDMQEENFDGARQCLATAKETSRSIREEVENQYEPLLKELESIVWVDLMPEPTDNVNRIYRFPGPIKPDRILEFEDDWARITIRTWIPNDEIVTRYREGPVIGVLFETPEMVYADITAWMTRGMIVIPEPVTPYQGVHFLLNYLYSCPTKDGKMLVYGTVTNLGNQPAWDVKALIRALYIDVDIDIVLSFPRSQYINPIYTALDMSTMPWMDEGKALVPVRPQVLEPSMTGIIVLTIDVPRPDVFLALSAEMVFKY